MQLPEPDRAKIHRRHFRAALLVMDMLNKQAEAEGYDAVAYGINSHAHLDEDMALRTTGVRHAPLLARKAQRAGPQSSTQLPTAAALLKHNSTCKYNTGQLRYSLRGTQAATSVDWVAKGFVTAIRDQGMVCGSCTAFATTVATKWTLMQRNATYNNVTTDLSENDLMHCECRCCCLLKVLSA